MVYRTISTNEKTQTKGNLEVGAEEIKKDVAVVDEAAAVEELKEVKKTDVDEMAM